MPRQTLDLTNPITKNDRATAYLEALFYDIFAAIDTTAQEVVIDTGVATVDLSTEAQFNITADQDFVIDIIGNTAPISRRNAISITNPGGAFDLTDITCSGATVYKSSGSSISTLGFDVFSILLLVPDDTKLQTLPNGMVPV